MYYLLPARRDALLDLLDSLCGSPYARSVIELNLSPLFRQGYSSITDTIDSFFQAGDPESTTEERHAREKQLARLVGQYLPVPQQRRFWLFGTDVVPLPRPFAQTLADRSFTYQSNPVAGNKPATIGHACPVIALLPEKRHPYAPRCCPC